MKETNKVDAAKSNELILVPTFEAGLEEVVNSGKVSIVANGVEELIPEDEKGMATIGESKYARAEIQGYFSEGIGMARLALKNGVALCASIQVDEKGRRKFEFRFQLPDGRFSPLLTVNQADLYLAVQNNFKSEGVGVKQLKIRMEKFMADITLDFLNTGIICDASAIQSVLRTLVLLRDQLPVYSERNERADRMEFYKDVIDAINGQGRFQPLTLAYEAKSYYPLVKCEMDFIARQFGLSATGLAKKLDRFGFLYRTPSSTGYQMKIRICSDEKAREVGISAYDNCYCIIKLDYISGQRQLGN